MTRLEHPDHIPRIDDHRSGELDDDAPIDVLEARGFVGRHPDPEDRRVTRVRLTIDGKGAVYRAHFRLGTPPSGLRDLSLEELRTLSNLMARAAEGYPWP